MVQHRFLSHHPNISKYKPLEQKGGSYIALSSDIPTAKMGR